MTTDTDTATEPGPAEVAAAVDDAAAAELAASSIEAAILSGDPDVTIDDLEAAEKQSRAAKLKAKATAALAERAAERARLARIAEIDAMIGARFGAHDGDLVALFDRALAAVRPLVAAARDHNRGVHEVLEELRGLGDLPSHLQPARHGDTLHLPDLDVFLGPVDLGALLAELSTRAVDAEGGRTDGLESMGSARTMSDLVSLAQLAPADASDVERLGVAQGERVGQSDRLRRVARIVAAGR